MAKNHCEKYEAIERSVSKDEGFLDYSIYGHNRRAWAGRLVQYKTPSKPAALIWKCQSRSSKRRFEDVEFFMIPFLGCYQNSSDCFCTKTRHTVNRQDFSAIVAEACMAVRGDLET
jgi:hypothetical protein